MELFELFRFDNNKRHNSGYHIKINDKERNNQYFTHSAQSLLLIVEIDNSTCRIFLLTLQDRQLDKYMSKTLFRQTTKICSCFDGTIESLFIWTLDNEAMISIDICK